MTDERKVFLDVLTLKPGKTFEEAQAYFAKAIPLIERHGLKRVEVFRISEKMRGHEEVNPSIVQVWRVDAENPFAALMADPAYKEVVPWRDSIFEMPKLQGWFGHEIAV
ncbi:MAG: hypothetical protein COW30_09950 [Rhodospirillales bacterium CG15_BIG_FIL_POST_REV_8_21_14_020_66_15]|nr:MAG: hypothetical protein COW30_09950 [Rhodospirillales bacterium CG15_BIG_FIL_POST_REV_8_21_14_020_66_15]